MASSRISFTYLFVVLLFMSNLCIADSEQAVETAQKVHERQRGLYEQALETGRFNDSPDQRGYFSTDSYRRVSFCSIVDPADANEVKLVQHVEAKARELGMQEQIIVLFFDFNDAQARQANMLGWGSPDYFGSQLAYMCLPKPSCYAFDRSELNFCAVLPTAYHELGHLYLHPRDQRQINRSVWTVMAVSMAAVVATAYGSYKLGQLVAPQSLIGVWGCCCVGALSVLASVSLFSSYLLKYLLAGGQYVAPTYFRLDWMKQPDPLRYSSVSQAAEIKQLIKDGEKETAEFYAASRENEMQADFFALEQLIIDEEYDAIILDLIKACRMLDLVDEGKVVDFGGLQYPQVKYRLQKQVEKLAQLGWSLDAIMDRMEHKEYGKMFEDLRKKIE